MKPDNVLGYKPITEKQIPELLDYQLQKFTMESIHAEPVASFDARSALQKLEDAEGQMVIGADFGGDKGVTKLFVVRNGRLEATSDYQDYVQGDHGDGYLESLEKTAKFARERNIPVGISWGAPLEGTRPLLHPKATVFLEGLQTKYDGDFKNLIPTMKSCMNDGPAGLVSGAIEANRRHNAQSVLFTINGGGLGMAVLNGNMLYAAEAGHVEGVEELNTYSQNESCGVYGSEYVCIERLGANKAGIEAQWEKLTGAYMRARDIEDRYKEGNELAAELYDHSALVVAHMIAGTADAFGIDLTSQTSAVVGHGGAFKFPFYGERIAQILGQHLGASPLLVMTKDYGNESSNACLDGAAMAALAA